MWAGPLHNPHFIQRILDMLPNLDPETYQTIPRIEGMLTTAMEEDLDLSPSFTKSAKQQQEQKSETETAESKSQEQNDYPAIIPRMNPALPERTRKGPPLLNRRTRRVPWCASLCRVPFYPQPRQTKFHPH
jgi:tRNA (guanine26-N2/guanine27-N2)-dimethyltransferase